MMNEVNVNDLKSKEAKRDPHAFYARLRAAEPLYYVDELHAWLTTTYEGALFVLRDPRLTKDLLKLASSEEELQGQDVYGFSSMRNMLMTDPPDHTRLRSLVSKAFTPRMIEHMRPRIQQIADELLDAVQEQRSMDLIRDFAYPLPITVILEMLGIPATERQLFRRLTQGVVNEPDATARKAAFEEFVQYIKLLLEKKRGQPGDDLTSGLVQSQEQGDQLSENELISMIFLLIVAGHETTVNLLGNGTLALLQHPDQLRLLQDDPSLINSAVEELLRYTAPVSISDERWATEDIPLYGNVIKKGEMVYAALIAANADPQQFPDATALELSRRENQHLAFGKGIHYCLGAPLARLEGQIAFGTLIRRLPDLRLADTPGQLVWSNNAMLRGVKSLPVTF